MQKLMLKIEFEYDDEAMHSNDQESVDWFLNEILGKDELFLYSNEIGDTIGMCKVLNIVKIEE